MLFSTGGKARFPMSITSLFSPRVYWGAFYHMHFPYPSMFVGFCAVLYARPGWVGLVEVSSTSRFSVSCITSNYYFYSPYFPLLQWFGDCVYIRYFFFSFSVFVLPFLYVLKSWFLRTGGGGGKDLFFSFFCRFSLGSVWCTFSTSSMLVAWVWVGVEGGGGR